jgi:hypothetical protein
MKANESAKQAVAVWQSQYKRLSEQTDKFTFDLFLDDAFRLGLRVMTKDEIEFFMAMQPVSHSFLEFSPQILAIWKPEKKAELRRNIAYLAALQEKQQKAVCEFIERGEREIEYIRDTVKLLKEGKPEGRQNLNKYLKHLGHG